MVQTTWRRSPFLPNVEHVKPPFVRKLYRENEIKIIDVRFEWEYEDHHIPGSILVPMHVLDQVLPNLGLNKIAIVCEHGNRTTWLVNNKYYLFKGMKVYNMIGGMESWMRFGYEVEKGMDENGEIWKRFLKKV